MECKAGVVRGIGEMWSIDVDAPETCGAVVQRTHVMRCHGDEHPGLDELITITYSLDGIDVGDQAMRDGENIRGVIVHGS
ncbi:MAG: hypothetical protein R8G01_00700 [Ilumatobacteraceae bacterium]|nr:hypothetical protein [Ilumatobacteraceae bacterium]